MAAGVCSRPLKPYGQDLNPGSSPYCSCDLEQVTWLKLYLCFLICIRGVAVGPAPSHGLNAPGALIK